MSTRQQMWTLIKFELQHSKLHLLLLSGIFILICYIVIPSFAMQLEGISNFFMLDMIFIFYFFIAVTLTRPKVYRHQKLNHSVWASHFLVQLQHLPIAKHVLIFYRMVAYFIILLPFYMIFLVTLYITTPTLQQLMSIGTYAVFSLMWLAINFLLLSLQTMTDFGTHIVQQILLIIFVIFPLTMIFVSIFYNVYEASIVYFTMWLANNYPFWSMCLLILLTWLGIYGCVKRIKRKTETIDYL